MKIDDHVLSLLKNDAKKAFKSGEIPVSAVVVDSNGKVVSHGFNVRQKSYDVLGHAEIVAIKKAENKIKDWRLDGYSMFVTLEPCNMCSMVIKECRLDHIYYFLSKKVDNSSDFVLIDKSLVEDYEEYKKFLNDLLTNFFDNRR